MREKPIQKSNYNFVVLQPGHLHPVPQQHLDGLPERPRPLQPLVTELCTTSLLDLLLDEQQDVETALDAISCCI